MSQASRERQRPFNQSSADECTKKARLGKFYKNLAKPGTYEVNGQRYAMDEKGSLRKAVGAN